MNGETILDWSRKHLAPFRDEAKLVAFLSLYGSDGLPLRELVELATLRASVGSSENHWQLSGETGPILRAVGDVIALSTHCSFMNAFVRECSKYGGVADLQQRLLSLGLIVVEYTKGHPIPRKHGWRTDERIWRVAENQISSHLMVPMWDVWDDLNREGIILDLLCVFLEMPGKDVSALAERHRETYYNHARLFALETLRFSQTLLKGAREYIVSLVLQLLTHRSQNGDRELYSFAKAWPSSVNGSDWAIMLLWAEMKGIAAGRGLGFDTALNNRIKNLLSWKGRRQRRANGLIGYLLVEWMKAAEASQNKKLTNQIVRFAMDWVETAWSSGSSIERAALCSVLANFRMLDNSVLISRDYYLLYGHHLSRAGHLEQACKFLASATFTIPFPTPLWGYVFELVSVLIRLGDREEAEKWLMIIDRHTMSQNGDEKEFNMLEPLRKHAEARALLGLYQADSLMAAGYMGLAASRLKTTISTVYIMDRNPESTMRGQREDGYFQSLRLALEIRLLEVGTWEGSPETALKVAEALVIWFRDTSCHEPDMIQWIIQQLLALSNRLVWGGNVIDASSLLESVLQICSYQHYSDSLQDILPYVQERRATINSLLVIDHAEKKLIAVGHESYSATNQLAEGWNSSGPSNEYAALTRNAMLVPADLIGRDPRGSSGTEDERRSNAQRPLGGLDLVEGPKGSKSATSEPTEDAPPKEPTSPRATSEERPASKQAVRRGLRMSVAAMLRRVPRTPTAWPGSYTVESREKESTPVSTDPPVRAELETA